MCEQRTRKLDSCHCFSVVVIFSAMLIVVVTEPEPDPRSYEDYFITAYTIGITLPFRLPLTSNTTVPLMETMDDCFFCPRVYWPVCTMANKTYINACVSKCANQTLRRYGPCIFYGRRNGVRRVAVTIPKSWHKGFFDPRIHKIPDSRRSMLKHFFEMRVARPDLGIKLNDSVL